MLLPVFLLALFVAADASADENQAAPDDRSSVIETQHNRVPPMQSRSVYQCPDFSVHIEEKSVPGPRELWFRQISSIQLFIAQGELMPLTLGFFDQHYASPFSALNIFQEIFFISVSCSSDKSFTNRSLEIVITGAPRPDFPYLPPMPAETPSEFAASYEFNNEQLTSHDVYWIKTDWQNRTKVSDLPSQRYTPPLPDPANPAPAPH